MFRDTLLIGSGQNPLVLPFELAGTGQKVAETGSKSGQYTAFYAIIDPENVLFDTFRAPFVTEC